LEKPLDKPHGMWYNISTKGEPINPTKNGEKEKQYEECEGSA
jgi:hypothetical protein